MIVTKRRKRDKKQEEVLGVEKKRPLKKQTGRRIRKANDRLKESKRWK